MKNDTLYCSFCGKNQHEVQKLIAGPTVFICDECVDLCKHIIEEERGTPKEPVAALLAETDVPPSRLPDYVARLKLAIEDEQRGRAEAVAEAKSAALDLSIVLRDLEFEANAYIEALLDIAFPDKSAPVVRPAHWAETRAYQALGGRIENGVRLDSYEDLKGDDNE
jgi:hypothetical protein